MKNRKILVSLIAGLLVFSLLFGFIAMLIPAVKAESSSEIQTQLDALEEQKSSLKDRMEDLESQQDLNVTEIRGIVLQKNNIDEQIALLHAQIAIINQQISAYSLLIADKQDELDAAQARLAELNEKNKDRIRSMEEDGSLSYWAVLFKANSFADLLDRLNMIEEIAAADQRRLAEMSRAAQEVADAQEVLESEKAALEVSRAELDAAEAELAVKRAEADELLTKLLEKGDELAALMAEFEEQEELLLAEIAKKEQEYNEAKQREYEQWLSTSEPEPSTGGGGGGGGNGGGGNAGDYYVGSDWIVPCYYVCVSSPFGYRTPPTEGASSFHAGVDLAGPQGTPIYASRGGYVTTATYGWSGGNYVTINHGDGYSSSYLHMTHYVVSAGQYVSQGQLIGYMGSTGVSTGSHLHFSIYLNGSPVNPADYIPI